MGIGSASVLEPPAFVAGLDDVAVVCEPVEHGRSHFGVAKNLRPVCEGEICRDQQRGVFVKLADKMEEQLTAGLAKRQISEFVDDDEIVAQQLLGQAAAFAGGLFLFQLIDQVDKIVEAAPGTRPDDRRGDGNAQMGFAGAWRNSDILPGISSRARRSFTIAITLGMASVWSSRAATAAATSLS